MTYNTRDSLVVTDPTTSLALTGLSMGERTGSRVLQWVWSYVTDSATHTSDRGRPVVQPSNQIQAQAVQVPRLPRVGPISRT